MTEKTSLERPRQVTTASLLVIFGSVLLVFTLLDTLGNLRSTDMRQSVEEFLAEPPGDGLGITVEQVLDFLHVLGLVAGALAATAFVLGVFVLQRHRGARTALTVVTVLLVMTMPVAGVMPVLLAIAIGMLWSRPARDWFNGVTPTQRAAAADTAPSARGADRLRSDVGGPPPGRPAVPPPAPSAPSTGGGWQPKPAGGWQPRPAAGWTAPDAQGQLGQPGQEQPAYGQPAYGQPAHGQPASISGQPAYDPWSHGQAPGSRRLARRRPRPGQAPDHRDRGVCADLGRRRTGGSGDAARRAAAGRRTRRPG